MNAIVGRLGPRTYLWSWRPQAHNVVDARAGDETAVWMWLDAVYGGAVSLEDAHHIGGGPVPDEHATTV